MEFGLREVLIAVGFVVIAGILFDGYRRMRRSKMGELGLPTEMGGSCEDTDAYYNGELPNGGSRTRKFNNSGDASSSQEGDGRVDPNFGDDIVAGNVPAVDISFTENHDEKVGIQSPDSSDRLGAVTTQGFDDDGIGGVRRYSFDSEDIAPEENVSDNTLSTGDLFEDDEMLLATKAAQEEKLASHYTGGDTGTKASRRNKSKKSTQTNNQAQDDEMPIYVDGLEEVIVLNLMAKPGEAFDGVELDKALTSCGFRFGDMNIYHRYEQHIGRGPLLFSIANVVEPGTFDPDNLEVFSTPGVCMFMKLPGPKRSVHSFELMVECGRKIVSLLNGDMKDEHHSIMTQQTVEHYRQRVLDFDRKLLSHRVTQRS